MSYRQKKDNFLFSLFQDMPTVGKYSMPIIKPIYEAKILNLLQFNYAKTCKNPDQYHLCFYIDDYQFERIWNEPQKGLELLKKFKGVIAPDFSLYRDFPMILNIYNCWRNKVLAAYYQANGLEVIPNVTWGDETTFDWCFDGLPQNSILAVSTNGCVKDITARKLFLKGFEEMKRRLLPTKIIIVGSIPKDLQNEPNIIHYPGYSSLFGKEDKSITYKGET